MDTTDAIIRVSAQLIMSAFLPTMEERSNRSNYSDGLKLGFWRNRLIPELPPIRRRITSGIIPAVAEDLTLPEDTRFADALLWWSYGLVTAIKPSAIIRELDLKSLEEYQFALDCLGCPLSKAWNKFKALNTIEMVIAMIAPPKVK